MKSRDRFFVFLLSFLFLMPRMLYADVITPALSRQQFFDFFITAYANTVMDTLYNCRNAALKYMEVHSGDLFPLSRSNDIALITPYLRKPGRVYKPSYEPYSEGHRAASSDKYAFYMDKTAWWVGRALITDDERYNRKSVLNLLHETAANSGCCYGSDNLNTPPVSNDRTFLFKPEDAVIWLQVK